MTDSNIGLRLLRPALCILSLIVSCLQICDPHVVPYTLTALNPLCVISVSPDFFG
jgi:hypothetical protein